MGDNRSYREILLINMKNTYIILMLGLISQKEKCWTILIYTLFDREFQDLLDDDKKSGKIYGKQTLN